MQDTHIAIMLLCDGDKALKHPNLVQAREEWTIENCEHSYEISGWKEVNEKAALR